MARRSSFRVLRIRTQQCRYAIVQQRGVAVAGAGGGNRLARDNRTPPAPVPRGVATHESLFRRAIGSLPRPGKCPRRNC